MLFIRLIRGAARETNNFSEKIQIDMGKYNVPIKEKYYSDSIDIIPITGYTIVQSGV